MVCTHHRPLRKNTRTLTQRVAYTCSYRLCPFAAFTSVSYLLRSKLRRKKNERTDRSATRIQFSAHLLPNRTTSSRLAAVEISVAFSSFALQSWKTAAVHRGVPRIAGRGTRVVSSSAPRTKETERSRVSIVAYDSIVSAARARKAESAKPVGSASAACNSPARRRRHKKMCFTIGVSH